MTSQRIESICRVLIFVGVALLLSSCGQKSAGLQEGAISPDQMLFDNGMKYLEKSQFIKARLTFQTLISSYPESEHTPAAFLSIADSYYRVSDTQNLLHAEAQYKDFIIFYPFHEMADDAQMKIVALNVKLMKAPDRDSSYAKRAETELNEFLENYPESGLAPTAREFLRQVEENRANGIQGVGHFYFKKGSYLASESRYKEVITEYPNYSQLDVSLYRLGNSLEQLGRIEEASVYYSRVVAEFPFSVHSGDAEKKLVLLEKPVPPVNSAVAERNKANQRTDEGFSLMKPVRGVVELFTGSEDPYDVAKRRAEEQEGQQTQQIPPAGQ
ncbi:MAG: outer membrane protein assembly factor BamD [Acidobacteriota bacterium]